MGQPDEVTLRRPLAEHIGLRSGTRGSETSQYPEEDKSKEILLVAASERRLAQTRTFRGSGVVGQVTCRSSVSRTVLERRAVEGESPVDKNAKPLTCIPSRAGHVKPGLNLGGPPSKAKYYPVTDSEPVP